MNQKETMELAKTFHELYQTKIMPKLIGMGDDFRSEEVRVIDRTSPTSDRDITINGLLMEFVRQIFGCSIYSEEGEKNIPKEQRDFAVIDPLDGTADWLAGLDVFGSAVTLVKGSMAVFSALFLPIKEFTSRSGFYFAAKDEGAWQIRGSHPHKLRVSSQTELAKAFLLFEGSSKKLAASPMISGMKRRIARSREIMCSSNVTALVASGSIWPNPLDGWISLDNAVWDDAPGMLFIPEAGGKVTDIDGNPPSTMMRSSRVFSNGHLHEQILKAVREYS